MSSPSQGGEVASSSIGAARPQRMSLRAFSVLVVLLYIGDFVLGVWALFYGFWFTMPYVSSASIINWACAWVLCYFGYRRSKRLGYDLVLLTGALTVLVLVIAFEYFVTVIPTS